jgi:hypothetical protein
MRKAVFTFLLAIIIVPVVLLTSSCKKDDSSPVGITHPYAGSWSLTVDTSYIKSSIIVSVDGSFYVFIPMFKDSLQNSSTVRKISGSVTTGGQISGKITLKDVDSANVQIGTFNGNLSGTTGSGSYINTRIPYLGTWGVIKE